MEKYKHNFKIAHHLASGALALAVNIALFFIIPKLPLPSNRGPEEYYGRLFGFLTLANIILVPIFVYNKLWLASAVLVLIVVFFVYLLLHA